MSRNQNYIVPTDADRSNAIELDAEKEPPSIEGPLAKHEPCLFRVSDSGSALLVGSTK